MATRKRAAPGFWLQVIASSGGTAVGGIGKSQQNVATAGGKGMLRFRAR